MKFGRVKKFVFQHHNITWGYLSSSFLFLILHGSQLQTGEYWAEKSSRSIILQCRDRRVMHAALD